MVEIIEKTFVMVKPDGVQRGLTGEIIRRFEQRGLKLIAMKMVWVDEELVKKHYPDDEVWLKSVGVKTKKSYEQKGVKVKETELEIGKRIRDYLKGYITSGPVIAMVIEGPHAISQVRKIVGSTSPHEAMPGTIRGDFSVDSYQMADPNERSIINLVHSSGDEKEAKNELSVWFNPKEMHTYKRVDEHAIYR